MCTVFTQHPVFRCYNINTCFTNRNYEGLQSHAHLKFLAMAPYQLPYATFIDQKDQFSE